MTIIGVDIGGTFTDFILLTKGGMRVHKQPTTRPDPADGLLEGLKALTIPDETQIVHGSTIATNALLEYRGARTALVTTKGFADVLVIGRQQRRDLYTLVPTRPRSYIPDERRIEVAERLNASGEVLTSLTDTEIERVVQAVLGSGAEAAAVCLLFGYTNPEHERRITAALQEHLYVTASHELTPEYREYERTSTTVMNSYVMPLMDSYISRLEEDLGSHTLRIMQSNGGMITPQVARREAARTALSGPAGGVVGAWQVAQQAGFERIITFDMGGTSTDVALVPGEVPLTLEATINGFPLRLPMVDLHTVGAGGGSIARVDSGGALRVGPESAGADPGPACYGTGEEPTVSDANLVLGRLHPRHFLGGEMQLYPGRAEAALQRLSEGLTAVEVAKGVLQVTNAAMERAIRVISVERGYDTRDFTLVAFGGAGPLHACELAARLGIPRVLIPPAAGVLSALGMALAETITDASLPLHTSLEQLTLHEIDEHRQTLKRQLHAAFTKPDEAQYAASMDMRYKGQSHELQVPQPQDDDWAAAFHRAHQQRYGYQRDGQPIEAVVMRLRMTVPNPASLPTTQAEGGDAYLEGYPVWFAERTKAGVYQRSRLVRVEGPALVVQMDSTIVVPPGWRGETDDYGNLVLTG
jgi:N-methylhydantoinase A